MGKDSKISWTTDTWNPWIGCHKVSPGCKHCYAETLVMRMGRVFSIVRRAAPATFNAPLKWQRSLLSELPRLRPDDVDGPRYSNSDASSDPPLPEYVFTCSLSDFFHEDADQWRDEAWEIIRRTPHLTYQILTKRPERIAEHLPKTCFRCGTPSPGDDPADDAEVYCHHFWRPWPNIWLGTSVENQVYAEKRISQLVNVPAVVHFLSCEPLLGPIDFGTRRITYTDKTTITLSGFLSDIEWVIVGGESGKDFREMNLDWARSIRDQCRAASVPFFYKQGNGIRSEMNPVLDGREWREMPK